MNHYKDPYETTIFFHIFGDSYLPILQSSRVESPWQLSGLEGVHAHQAHVSTPRCIKRGNRKTIEKGGKKPGRPKGNKWLKLNNGKFQQLFQCGVIFESWKVFVKTQDVWHPLDSLDCQIVFFARPRKPQKAIQFLPNPMNSVSQSIQWFQRISSRKLTYPTLGKRKIIFKHTLRQGYDILISSQEGKINWNLKSWINYGSLWTLLGCRRKLVNG